MSIDLEECQHPNSNSQRCQIGSIDGLRGIAAIAVVGFHFYSGSPLKDSLSKILPPPISLLLEHGHLGVEIFFVISGFVIAYSLRKTLVTSNSFFKFIFFRFLRLNPPYWITIFLTVLSNAISNFVFTDRKAELPSMASTAAHLFYLQGILNFTQISPVFWTLCIEFQFYIIFFILVGCEQYLLRNTRYPKSIVLLFTILLSILVSIIINFSWIISSRSKFSTYWYMFLTGAITYWTFERKLNHLYFWAFSLLLLLNLTITKNIEILVVLFIGVLIYFASRHGKLYSWLGNEWFQYTGKISYSIYLVHPLIGTRLINLGYRLTGDSPIPSLFWFLLAFATSLVAAHTMYLYIEEPCLKFSKKLKEKLS